MPDNSNTEPSGSPGQPTATSLYAFDRSGAERVVEAVKVVEGLYKNGAPTSRASVNAARGPRIAQTGAGGIPARAGTKPGKAPITLYSFDYNDNLVKNSSKDTLYGFNLSTTAVGASRWIIVVNVQGRWVADWEDC
jgi:hypothetical protein